ncbi:MAG: hypothetical protein ABSE55_05330 [Terracidiphilus sp.]|jgi:hypothetical protein
MRQMGFNPEYAVEGDKFYNYALWPYAPTLSLANRLKPSNLLLESWDAAGVDRRFFDLIPLLRQAIGEFHTVFGVKQQRSRTWWEFYFYDYRRRERERSLTRVLEALRPLAPSTLTPNENIFYFMFSIDITEEIFTRGIDEAHLYIGNPGSSVSSGISYSLTSTGTKFENIYFFFDARNQLQDTAAKIACSAHIDTRKIAIDEILRPELRVCKTICVANKQENDCVYFAGIGFDQFLFFLRWMRYRAELIAFLEENRTKLDHLDFDVGFDYRMDGDKLTVIKSGYYGIF